MTLEGFDGDLGWILAFEGHNDRPFWPGGISGVTLSPGLDLGHADRELIEQVFEHVPKAAELEGAIGLRGEQAARWLAHNPLAARIDEPLAAKLFPMLLWPAWKVLLASAANKWSYVEQEVLLSLAYNRGAQNRDVSRLYDRVTKGSLVQVGREIAMMQQDHDLRGIRRRRRAEGWRLLDHGLAQVDYWLIKVCNLGEISRGLLGRE